MSSARSDDPDARENYRIWLRFRQRLLDAPTIEATYVGLFAGEGVDVAPLFVHQLTQLVLRHILGEDARPFHARAAEMLFRSQKVTVRPDGAVIAADEQTVELYATGRLRQRGRAARIAAHADANHRARRAVHGR